MWRKIGSRKGRFEADRGEAAEVFVRGLHNNQPPWGVGMIWRSAGVALGGRQEEVRRSGLEAGDAATRQERRWRQGEVEARVIFSPGFVGWVLVFLLFLFFDGGRGELLVKGERRKFGVEARVGKGRQRRGEGSFCLLLFRRGAGFCCCCFFVWL